MSFESLIVKPNAVSAGGASIVIDIMPPGSMFPSKVCQAVHVRSKTAKRVGTIWINDVHPYLPQAERGGYKQSGNGRELGPTGLAGIASKYGAYQAVLGVVRGSDGFFLRVVGGCEYGEGQGAGFFGGEQLLAVVYVNPYF